MAIAEFAPQGYFIIKDSCNRSRPVFSVICTQDIPLDDLMGKQVKIDGIIYTCRGVERLAINLTKPIVAKGENVGIWIE
jgi:hypothetical protein